VSFYLWLDLAVVAGPVILSFDRRVGYYRVWPAVLLSLLAVGVPFLIWDIIATSAGIWGFSDTRAGETALFGLPLAEVLFFVVVPFGCLFIYEVLSAYLTSARIRFPPWLGYSMGALSFVAALAVYPRAYTSVVLGAVGLLFVLASWLNPRFLSNRTVWLSLAVSFLPFALVNGILTSLPVVFYNPREILGLRIYTIPLEDFFYSFSLIGFVLLVHTALRERLRFPAPRSAVVERKK